MKSLSRFLQKHRSALFGALLVAAFYLLLFTLGISCPIKFLIGISCPGCGMTRACLSALRLDFAAAFSYHPLWVLLPPIALLLLWESKKAKRLFLPTLLLFVLALSIVYAFRLSGGGDGVIAFSPEDGFIYKQFSSVFSLFR